MPDDPATAPTSDVPTGVQPLQPAVIQLSTTYRSNWRRLYDAITGNTRIGRAPVVSRGLVKGADGVNERARDEQRRPAVRDGCSLGSNPGRKLMGPTAPHWLLIDRPSREKNQPRKLADG